MNLIRFIDRIKGVQNQLPVSFKVVFHDLKNNSVIYSENYISLPEKQIFKAVAEMKNDLQRLKAKIGIDITDIKEI